MRILMLSGYPLTERVSGSLVHAAKLSQYLSAMEGMQVHVMTLGNTDKRFRSGNIDVHVISQRRLLNPLLFPLAWRSIKRTVREISPDIVHTMRGFPYTNIGLSLRKKYPVVMSVFSLSGRELSFDQSLMWKLKRRLVFIPSEKYVNSRMPQIIVQTHFMESLIRNDTQAKIHIVPEGIEVDRLQQFQSPAVLADPPDIFIAVSFRKLKGIDILIRAVPAVLQAMPDLKVCIGGAGEEDANLKNLVKELGVAGHVKFPGFITDEATRYGYYAACKIVVVPSRWDNEPFAALDGAALGKPVIASEAANASVVVDGQTGYVFKSEDIDTLASQIITLLTDDRLRGEMGRAIKEKVKEYDWPRIAEKTASVYREVIDDFKLKVNNT
jgi:glycosyltransferase involved in cell wall biosynthesis